MPERTGLHPGEKAGFVCGGGAFDTIEDSWALVLPEDFQQDQVYPRARVVASDQASARTVVPVLGTELFEAAVKVLVTFEAGGNAQH